MRVNVYSEEITNRVEIVYKEAEGRQFVGMRFNLLTHENMVPPQHADDDSSAVTFWFDRHKSLSEFRRLVADAKWLPKSATGEGK